jgi:protein arginine kinase
VNESRHVSDSLILVSSVAVVRNDAATPFPHAADEGALGDILDRVRGSLESDAGSGEWEFEGLDSVSTVRRTYLVEQGLMTPAFARERGPRRAYAFTRSGEAAVEVNGGEHVRLLASRRGECLSGLWSILDVLDDRLEAGLTYAFDDDWGYLTSSPAAAGTGLSAYATVHAPGLMVSGALGGVAMELVRRGLALLPLWEGAGGMFQVTNRGGGGARESAAIDAVAEAAHEVAEREQTVRRVFLRDDPVRVKDHIGRSLGIAQHAWSVSTAEALSLISAVEAGVAMGVVSGPGLTAQEAFSLMQRVQPGHLAVLEQGAADAGLDGPRNDEIRARILRDRFRDMRVAE